MYSVIAVCVSKGSLAHWSCLPSSKWWSEAQEKKRLVADPRDTKVKKKLRSLKLHPGFPSPAVAQAYLEPAVDQSDSSFSWGRLQLDMIKEYPFSLSVDVFWFFVRVCSWIWVSLTVFYILPESFWLEQSEDRRDSSACDQTAQHSAGNWDITQPGTLLHLTH